jgi:hypothetical protein
VSIAYFEAEKIIKKQTHPRFFRLSTRPFQSPANPTNYPQSKRRAPLLTHPKCPRSLEPVKLIN